MLWSWSHVNSTDFLPSFPYKTSTKMKVHRMLTKYVKRYSNDFHRFLSWDLNLSLLSKTTVLCTFPQNQQAFIKGLSLSTNCCWSDYGYCFYHRVMVNNVSWEGMCLLPAFSLLLLNISNQGLCSLVISIYTMSITVLTLQILFSPEKDPMSTVYVYIIIRLC